MEFGKDFCCVERILESILGHFRVPFLGPSKEEKEKGGQKWPLLKDPLLDPFLDPTFASILLPFNCCTS